MPLVGQTLIIQDDRVKTEAFLKASGFLREKASAAFACQIEGCRKIETLWLLHGILPLGQIPAGVGCVRYEGKMAEQLQSISSGHIGSETYPDAVLQIGSDRGDIAET